MVEFTDTQLLAWVSAFMWPLTRILGIFSSAPLFAHGSLPMQPRVVYGHETSYPPIDYFQKGRQLGTKKDIASPYASVRCGPLLFALPIPDKDANTPEETTDWNYALPGDLTNASPDMEVIRQKMPAHWSWQLADAPVQLRLPARRFEWHPTELEPLPKEAVTGGRPARITLIPYGCTKFRVAMFPVAQ